MTNSETGLSIEILWFDEDMLDIRIKGSNGVFGGETRIYADRAGLGKLPAFVMGFPHSLEDRRLIEMGTFDPGFAGGGARLGLRCLEGARHVVLDVLLATQVENNRHQRVEFWLEIEPQALREFGRKLEALEVRKGESVGLPMRDPAVLP